MYYGKDTRIVPAIRVITLVFITCQSKVVTCVIIGLVAVVWGQDRPVCEVPRAALRSKQTVFTPNTTAMVKPKRSVLRLTTRVFRSPKRLIKEGKEATATNASSWIVVKSAWLDLCPERVTYIQPPMWFMLGGQICFTPLPWRNYRYPTVQCVSPSCRYVNRPLFFCRLDGSRIYTIPIYCYNPKTRKFVRRMYSIYTYRCCNCSRYGCPIIRAP